ncbi:hypothetical protein DLM46_15160 [Paraburkholderia lacunae]|uniref:Uncharacterized protein n=1 Tax=Paraburkholderia lacunae TaxID=2211104 RepID=A0A370N7W8_9BURK|nr:hypothetical protein DLM46_15160 [Paraburkholderia lacunae]
MPLVAISSSRESVALPLRLGSGGGIIARNDDARPRPSFVKASAMDLALAVEHEAALKDA